MDIIYEVAAFRYWTSDIFLKEEKCFKWAPGWLAFSLGHCLVGWREVEPEQSTFSRGTEIRVWGCWASWGLRGVIFERRRAQRRCLEIHIEVLLSWAKYDVTHAQERLSETWQKRASGLSCMPPSEFLKRKSEGPTVCQEPSNSDHPDSEDLAEHGRPSTKTPKRLQP